jgi:hypothetical protein
MRLNQEFLAFLKHVTRAYPDRELHLVAVPVLALPGDLPGDLQHRDQRGGAVADVMAALLGVPGLYRHGLLRPVQRLDLGLRADDQLDQPLESRNAQEVACPTSWPTAAPNRTDLPDDPTNLPGPIYAGAASSFDAPRAPALSRKQARLLQRCDERSRVGGTVHVQQGSRVPRRCSP